MLAHFSLLSIGIRSLYWAALSTGHEVLTPETWDIFTMAGLKGSDHEVGVWRMKMGFCMLVLSIHGRNIGHHSYCLYW